MVDRADLDYQTTREFNHFSKGSVDGTNNTRELVRQFGDPSTKLIVTTIQKLNNAVICHILNQRQRLSPDLIRFGLKSVRGQ